MDTDLGRLAIYIEQLERVVSLINEESAVAQKVAIILLDSMGDALMYRRCNHQFDHDSAFCLITPPKFTVDERKETNRDFKKKLQVLRKLGVLNEEHASVLRIGHSYRNAAYHRDTHNPRVTKHVAKILLRSICVLFQEYYDNGVSVGATKVPEILSKYGFTSYVNLHSASATTSSKLLKDVAIEFVETRGVMIEDVQARLAELDVKLSTIPLDLESPWLDEGLKLAEFSKAHPRETLLGNVLELNYKIVSGRAAEVSAKQYKAAGKRAEARRAKAFREFTPKSSVKMWRSLRTSKTISKAQTLPMLLANYEQVDSKLSQLEVTIEELVAQIDLAAEMAADISRGK
jgi:hypothetical protein